MPALWVPGTERVKGALTPHPNPPFLFANSIVLGYVIQTKKNASKNIDFWPSYNASKLVIFEVSEKRFLMICDVIWDTLFWNQVFLRVQLSEEMVYLSEISSDTF